MYLQLNVLVHGFSNCGMYTAAGMPIFFYWYAALIKMKFYKRIVFKNKYNISYTNLLICSNAGNIMELIPIVS